MPMQGVYQENLGQRANQAGSGSGPCCRETDRTATVADPEEDGAIPEDGRGERGVHHMVQVDRLLTVAGVESTGRNLPSRGTLVDWRGV